MCIRTRSCLTRRWHRPQDLCAFISTVSIQRNVVAADRESLEKAVDPAILIGDHDDAVGEQDRGRDDPALAENLVLGRQALWIENVELARTVAHQQGVAEQRWR